MKKVWRFGWFLFYFLLSLMLWRKLFIKLCRTWMEMVCLHVSPSHQKNFFVHYENSNIVYGVLPTFSNFVNTLNKFSIFGIIFFFINSFFMLVILFVFEVLVRSKKNKQSVVNFQLKNTNKFDISRSRIFKFVLYLKRKEEIEIICNMAVWPFYCYFLLLLRFSSRRC